MSKRILALFLTTVLTFSLSSCNQTENVPSEVTVSETSIEFTLGETIPITERETTASETTEATKSENIEYYDWVDKLVAEEFYIGGINFPVPCSVEEFPEGFTLNDSATPSFFDDVIIDILCYEGKNIGNFYYFSSDRDYAGDIAIVAIDEIDIDDVKIGEMSIKDDYNKMIELFGEPSFMEGGGKYKAQYYYVGEYYQISFGYEKDNLTLEGISIYNNIVADEFDESKEED